MPTPLRTRWAALGAAVAVTLGAGGGFGLAQATISSGVRAVFVPIEPCRVLDTRPASAVGDKTSPLGPGEHHDVDVRPAAGDCAGEIPASATAVSVNVTAVNATQQTNLKLYPAGTPLPATANLNPSPADARTFNAATTGLSDDSEFTITNFQGSVDVIIDINGFFDDHDHDDRYDTSAEVNAKIADAIEVVTASGGAGPTYTPQFTPNREQEFTTTRAGTLHITGTFGIGYGCNAGAAWYYLLLDGEPLETSTRMRTDSELSPLPYIGVTDGPMPAGTYTLSMGVECAGPGGASSSGSRTYTAVSVLVLP